MIIASATGVDGRKYLVIGLSNANLDRLRADGMNGFIKIDGKEMNLPIDMLISAGSDETSMTRAFAALIGPETRVHISEKVKS